MEHQLVKQLALRLTIRVLLVILVVHMTAGESIVQPSCSEEDDKCEFLFVLRFNMTMMIYPDGPWGEFFPVIINNDTFQRRDNHNCFQTERLTQQEEEQLLSVDGYHKMAMLYNGSLPGPAIVVYEGQQVIIKLKNDLPNEATTLHFHGLHQRNTPWMDGAGQISQCPVLPGEIFTYRFIADPVGSHWYHSHYATQRTMGAYGPFIILPRNKQREAQIRGSDPLPDFDKEFILSVSDWMHHSSLEILEMVKREAQSWIGGFDQPASTCFNSTKQSDGLDCGVVPFVSGLINGKGRLYDENDTATRPVPLEVFNVAKGGKYRFRVICASMTFSFRISIDGHMLNIISTDGHDVITKQVESVIVSAGERYDFWIDAPDPDNLGSYWIRAETLERTQNNKPIIPHHTEAILRYENSLNEGDPVSLPTPCTQKARCTVLNCPFLNFGPKENRECITLTELQSTTQAATLMPEDAEDPANFHEFFLNFHYAKKGDFKYKKWQPTINGIEHVQPTAPPQIYPDSKHMRTKECNFTQCLETICRCTHSLYIPLGSVVQFIFAVSVYNKIPGILNGISHPVHLHGQHFQVIKVGYPVYNKTTSKYLSMSPDLLCNPASELCNQVTWSNSSWSGGNVPDTILQGAPAKDTVSVPVGGYVVVRFKADNPGFWYMHCHTEFHNEEGMALYVQTGNISQMNVPPENMNSCGDFQFSDEEFQEKIRNPVSTADAAVDPEVNALGDCLEEYLVLQWVAFAMAAFSTVLAGVSLSLLCKFKLPRNGYSYIPSDPTD